MVLFPEFLQETDGFLPTNLRFPAGIALDLAVVSDIDQLVARAALMQNPVHGSPGERLNLIHQLKQRNRILRTAPNVVNLCPGGFNIQARSLERPKQVIHAEHVADLAAIAIDHTASSCKAE